MGDGLVGFLENPLFALGVTLFLGVLAVSGKLSQRVAQVMLVGVWTVGSLAIMQSGIRDFRIITGAILVLAGFCFFVSYWIKPEPSKAGMKPNSTIPAAGPKTAPPTAALSAPMENQPPPAPRERQHKETRKSEKPATVGPITVQPGAAVSIGQQGGVTAGTYVNPPPNPYAPVVTYERNGVKHIQVGNRFTAEAGLAMNAFQQIMSLFTEKRWQDLIDFCELKMKEFPEWLTPYEFAARGYGALGQDEKAIGMLKDVARRAAGNPEYSGITELLRSLGVAISPP
jgi:hypothetical protein